MRSPLHITTLTILTLALPIAAFANLTGTPALSNGTSLSLDTGTTSTTPAGDILWNGTAMVPQGNAAAFNLGPLGQPEFGIQTQLLLSYYPYKQSNITATLTDVFAVRTNGGNFAAVLVTALNQGSITLQFITFGSTAVAGAPSITQVLNNYGLISAGFSNSGIAQGSLFTIKGTGLASPTALAMPLQSSTTGLLPTGLNGSSVTVTAGGVTVTPVFYYATNSQLALVLPSTTPIGPATVTVTYNGVTSIPFPFQVVATAMGFDSFYGSGSGLGLAVNATTGLVYTFGSPIPPGATIELYGSGLGADAQRDMQYANAPFTIKSLAHIYIGGVDAPIYYQGASGFPGLNQVNVTIPLSVPTGCNIPVTGVSFAGVPTNTITLPISNGPCSDPSFGITGSQLQTLTGLANVRTGFLAISQTTLPSVNGAAPQVLNGAAGTFQQFTAAAYSAASYSTSSGGLSLGGCAVSQGSGASSVFPVTTPISAGTITVSGPVGTLQTLTLSSPGIYSSTLPAGFIPNAAGAFALSGLGGTGPGANVGAFSAQVSFTSPQMAWTNQSAAATVTRSAGLPITWSGGGVNSFMIIYGVSSTGTGALSASFSCNVPTSAGQFTVPSYVLAALPAGNGNVFVENYTNFQTFTAPGLDLANAAGYISFEVNSIFN